MLCFGVSVEGYEGVGSLQGQPESVGQIQIQFGTLLTQMVNERVEVCETHNQGLFPNAEGACSMAALLRTTS